MGLDEYYDRGYSPPAVQILNLAWRARGSREGHTNTEQRPTAIEIPSRGRAVPAEEVKCSIKISCLDELVPSIISGEPITSSQDWLQRRTAVVACTTSFHFQAWPLAAYLNCHQPITRICQFRSSSQFSEASCRGLDCNGGLLSAEHDHRVSASLQKIPEARQIVRFQPTASARSSRNRYRGSSMSDRLDREQRDQKGGRS